MDRFHKVIQLAAIAAIGGFLFGFDTAVTNGAVDATAADFELGPVLNDFTVSSALPGCMIGAYMAGRLADALGRVKVMVIAAELFTASETKAIELVDMA